MRNQGRLPFRKHRVCWTTTISSSCFLTEAAVALTLSGDVIMSPATTWRTLYTDYNSLFFNPSSNLDLIEVPREKQRLLSSEQTSLSFWNRHKKSNEKQIYFELPLTLSTLTLGKRISEPFRGVFPTLVMFQPKNDYRFYNKTPSSAIRTDDNLFCQLEMKKYNPVSISSVPHSWHNVVVFGGVEYALSPEDLLYPFLFLMKLSLSPPALNVSRSSGSGKGLV